MADTLLCDPHRYFPVALEHSPSSYFSQKLSGACRPVHNTESPASVWESSLPSAEPLLRALSRTLPTLNESCNRDLPLQGHLQNTPLHRGRPHFLLWERKFHLPNSPVLLPKYSFCEASKGCIFRMVYEKSDHLICPILRFVFFLVYQIHTLQDIYC